MKLRFKGNSLRLRLNQTEVQKLAAGTSLQEAVDFPGGSSLNYILENGNGQAAASFTNGVIRVGAPADAVEHWASSEEIGMYFDLAASGRRMRIAIEKDLECTDGPVEDRDPDAFPRAAKAC